MPYGPISDGFDTLGSDGYPPEARLAILELKASQGWSLKQTAQNFQVTPATVAAWMKRLDEDGPEALVQTPVPVNRFPDYVRYMIRRFKTLCPTMGKVKIAETLARAGLHLGATTVRRMLKQKHRPTPEGSLAGHRPKVGRERTRVRAEQCIVTAKYPNHVWHVDLSVVPTGLGFWVPWLPLSLRHRSAENQPDPCRLSSSDGHQDTIP